ncbi:ABC transporter ATP-binding protein [Sporosalibacterium faouarense]|uniref:ABC transporter ATP-binding protein n=1 Tax=Sporosalibacterium faouarense TaxID=516123 RepID=UPI00141D3130|nr:ABC transporter ATP-binding protein [Sporosalibacterium faouarense]MTI46701.1 ABC transporter ATP-binding protein [Bacillota bacterium]
MGKDNRKILLDVKDLSVSFDTYAGEVQAVRGNSFYVRKGEALGIVGESGSGKSVTVKSLIKLLPMPPARIKTGTAMFNGKDLVKMSDKQLESIRGSEISMIFQDPMTSLNPTMKVGSQIMEGLIKHQKMSKKEAREKAIEMLRLVGIPTPEKRIDQYPHEFSGGMRQRGMIAIALACNPKLLVADEPTTALDVTIQAQILDLMKDLQEKMETSIILITHDLGVIADVAERVIVMYGGLIMEEGSIDDVFYRPQHPYTWGLLKSVPRLDNKAKERLIPIEGTPPDLFSPPEGCPFAARCEYAMPICKEQMPERTSVSETHSVFCWLQHDMAPNVVNPVIEGRGK